MTATVISSIRPWGARLLVAMLVGTGAGLAAVAPAHAAACERGSGVTVVVNGDVRCDANGGGPAAANFRDVGHSLRPVSTQPGFVCQVNGSPASDPCINTPPSNAYWALWWSDGTSGSWNYSDSGVSGLTVPAGGWVAFVFQTSSGRTPPSVRPVAAAPAPAPAQPPSGGSGSGGSGGSGSGGGGGSATAPSTAPGATPGATPEATPGTDPSADPSADPSSAATSADERDDKTRAASPSGDGSGGGPWSIVLAVLAIACVGAAAFLVNRRRQSGA